MLETESLVREDVMVAKQEVRSKHRPTFAIVCGLLGLVAFVQLVTVGVALAARVGETRVVEVTEAGDVKVVYIPTLSDARPDVEKQQPRSYKDILKAYGNGGEGLKSGDVGVALAKDGLITPIGKIVPRKRTGGVGIRPKVSVEQGKFLPIKSSRAEKLVEEAKSLHLSGDVVRAVLKLAEAEVIDKNEPAIIYRRALIFEDMRNWERAGDEYDKLFAMGPEVGAYYEIATDKIANGIKDAPDVVAFQLGSVVQRVSEDQLMARVTIPVRRLSTREIEPSQIDVRVFFYDIVDNKVVEPVPQQREKNIEKRWVTEPTDWSRNNVESAEAVYQLPELALSDVHLFGERRYFGHVVELYYKGELMDQFAHPGRLHGIHAKDQYKQHIDPGMMYDTMPGLEGLDGEGMLLPTLEE